MRSGECRLYVYDILIKCYVVNYRSKFSQVTILSASPNQSIRTAIFYNFSR